VNPLGHPVVLHVTPAQVADSPQLPELLEGLETEAVLADKGYDSATNRAAIARQGATPCIPPRKNRRQHVEYDRHLYRERNVVERFFGTIKQYRRVATRDDKKAANYLGFVWVASLAIMLA
jgi:putative transposase